MYTYKTKGTCSQAIEIDVQDDIVRGVRFIAGCMGNTMGVASLVAGMPVDEVIKRLQGIECRNGTSCPDQLARALVNMKNEASARA